MQLTAKRKLVKKVKDIAQFGSNTKTIIKDENSMVMIISDETGEGKMTVHQILQGIMICFTDMHMEQCMSEFELNSGQKVLCIDHCREGRIEMENQPGIFSIMQENELRVDDRKHHKGMAYYPLRHYHGVSIFLEVHEAQTSLDEMFQGFSIDLSKLREKYCHFVKPYVIREEEELNHILSSFYQHNRTLPEISKAKEYYMIKVVELLLYLNVLCVENIKENKPYYDKTQMEKIRAIHEQITTNLQERVTIEELSKQYDIPATSMKKCFCEIYGDSIYSYQKRYRMNVAANLLMEDSKIEIQEIALKMGYENPGKFSSAFKSVMGVTPAKYRMRKEGI